MEKGSTRALAKTEILFEMRNLRSENKANKYMCFYISINKYYYDLYEYINKIGNNENWSQIYKTI